MKRALVPGVLVLLLALSACSGGETTGEQAEATPAATTAQAGAEATDTDAPLTAKTVEPTPEPSSPESGFLAEVRQKLPDNTTIPNATDAQLLAAGDQACAQMAQGTDFSAVKVIEGEQPNDLGVHPDSALIAAVARKTLCV